MRLNSITANRHIFDGRWDGKPLRLLLTFDNDRVLRLQVAGDGEGMVADKRPLDAPFDMDEFGQVDIADVSELLFPMLCGLEVTEVEGLAWHGKTVGVTLKVASAEPFHFWVEGDELHWGESAALARHDWLDGVAPITSERIDL